jgi:hypothetical protein
MYIYLKANGSRYIFLVFYVDDILLAINDNELLFETKRVLSSHFDMKWPLIYQEYRFFVIEIMVFLSCLGKPLLTKF